jgi:PAS domain S-box-containing protein
MSVPDITPEEQQRLMALYSLGILDTEREDRFDRITRLAAALLNVPIALVTLVDRDRHWFKSAFGVDIVESARDSRSFCGHAIRSDALFVVPDTLTDAHFSGSNLVTGDAGIRFYAGYPLKAADGSRVGTLCVMDRTPRTLTAAQEAQLKDFAAVVEGELNSARQNSVVRSQLATIVENSNDAIYSRTLDGVVTSWNAGAEKMLGYAAAEIIGKSVTILIPPDRSSNLAANDQCVLQGNAVAHETNRLTKDGQVIPVIASHSPTRDGAGNVTGVSIILQDITKLRRTQAALEASEARFRATFEQAAVGIAHIDVQTLHIRTANEKFCQLLGYAPDELIGADARAVTPADDIPACEAERSRVITGATRMSTTERRLIRKDGQTQWFRRNLSLMRDAEGHPSYFIAVLDDIEARKQAELMLALQKNILEQVASGVSLRDVLTILAQSIEAHAGDILCSILLLDRDGVHLRHGAAPSLPQAYCRAIDGLTIGPAVGSCGTAAFRGEAVIVEDIACDPLWTDFRDLALSHGLHACWSTPILDTTRKVLGTFALYYSQPGRPTARHRELVRLATHLAVIAIAKHESEEALRMMQLSVDRVSDSVFWISREGRILYVNEAACATRGYSRKELLGTTIFDLNPNFPSGKWEKHFDALKLRGNMSFESSHRMKDGHLLPVDVTENYVNINGQEFNFSFSRDITERKRIEEKNVQLAAIVENSVDAIYSRTLEGTITSWNYGAEKMLGYPAAEAIGKSAAV